MNLTTKRKNKFNFFFLPKGAININININMKAMPPLETPPQQQKKALNIIIY